MKREAHRVVPWAKCDARKDEVGPEDVARFAIHHCTPPRMPNLIEEQQAPGRRLDLDIDSGSLVADQACSAWR